MEVKNCPFCGGEGMLTKKFVCVGHGDYCDEYFVTCKECKARGQSFDDYLSEPLEKLICKAIEAWNRRCDNGESNL